MDRTWDPTIVADALDALEDLPQWRLTPARWEPVAGIVDQMRKAFDAHDPGALRVATADLELYGPMRITRIDRKEVAGPDKQLLDRQNRLVHDLRTATPRPA